MSASNGEILKAYFFGLKLDEILDQKLDDKLTPSFRQSYHLLSDDERKIGSKCLREAIFETEEYFELFDFE